MHLCSCHKWVFCYPELAGVGGNLNNWETTIGIVYDNSNSNNNDSMTQAILMESV